MGVVGDLADGPDASFRDDRWAAGAEAELTGGAGRRQGFEEMRSSSWHLEKVVNF